MLKNQTLFKTIVKITLFSLVLAMSMFAVPTNAQPPSYAWRDVMSRLKKGEYADHEIYMYSDVYDVNQTTDTITIEFDASPGGSNNQAHDFDLSSIDYTDIDLLKATSGGPYNDACRYGTQIPLAATPSSTEYGVSVNTTNDTITFTPTTDVETDNNDQIPQFYVVCAKIGLNATYGGNGDHQIQNPSASQNDVIIAVGGGWGQSAKMAVSIVDDDRVTVTATVEPVFTFSISDNVIGFGSLNSSAARYATGDGNGSDSDVEAHNMQVETNAANGYVVTYNGPTLTSGSNTIDPATIVDDWDGTPGTEQFAMSLTTDGDATITSAYRYNNTPPLGTNWKWEASTTVTIIQESGPTSTETFGAHYIANISSLTEAGTYGTTVTFIATGTF